jgi:hypothetical protein
MSGWRGGMTKLERLGSTAKRNLQTDRRRVKLPVDSTTITKHPRSLLSSTSSIGSRVAPSLTSIAHTSNLSASKSTCNHPRIAQEGTCDRRDVESKCGHGPVSSHQSITKHKWLSLSFFRGIRILILVLVKSRSSPSTSARPRASKKSPQNVRPRIPRLCDRSLYWYREARASMHCVHVGP